MPEAIVTTREYDGTCTVRIGRSLILSSLSRAAADRFVATYRRLAVPDLAGTNPATGGRPGQVAHRSVPAAGRAARVKREQG